MNNQVNQHALAGCLCILLLFQLTTHVNGETNVENSSESQRASIPGPEVTVEPVLGVPTFVVDEEPFGIPAFETYTPKPYFFQQFADAGIRLFLFNTNVSACDYGHSPPTWIDFDTWDYSNFEERAAHVLEANPNAMLLLRVNLGTPRWWIDAHPEEWEILEDGSSTYAEENRSPTLPHGGPFPSIASEKWREANGMALRGFLEHVQNSKYGPHVFGYVLNGLHTEEWYPWSAGLEELSGYGAPTQRAFRKWLRKKYQSDEALQKSWSDSAVTLSNAEVPLASDRRANRETTFRDVSTQMNVIDFYVFYNELIPETIDYFAKIAREVTGGKKALGAFYGFMYEFAGDPEYGHNALAKFNRSPYLDFIYVTASYSGREFAKGGDFQRGPAYSVQLHDKLWYHDNDVISFLGKEILQRIGFTSDSHWSRNLDHHLKALGYTETPQQTRWMYRRGLGFCIAQGAYFCFFDLHGGYYDHPDLLDEVTKLSRVAELSIRFDRRTCSEVLIVSDENSNAYATFNSSLLAFALRENQHQLIKLGAPQDHVLLTDLDRVEASRYKLVVFLNCFNVSDEQRELIASKFKRDERTLVWCYAPGYFKGNVSDPSYMQDLTGLNIQPSPDETQIEIKTELLDAEFGLNQEFISRGKRVMELDTQGWGKLFSVKGQGFQKLGFSVGREHVTLARKNMKDWTSIYTWSPALPAAAWRELAREAGVHIFNEVDDSFYANSNFLSIHANGSGPRTIRLPYRANVMDMFTEEIVWPNAKEFTYDFENGETLLLKWRPWL